MEQVAQDPDSNSGNRLVWSIVGVALGIGLLYAATRQVELGVLISTLKSTNWVWAVGVFAATFLFNSIKAWRWGMLLRFLPSVRFMELLSAVYVGLAANFVVVHVGEFIRATIVARRRNAAISAVFTTVVVERALDFIAFLILMAILWALVPHLPPVVNVAAVFVAIFVLVAISGLYFLLRPPGWFSTLAGSFAGLLPPKTRNWLGQQIERSRLGLKPICDVGLMSLAIAVSVLQWVFVIVAIWWSAKAVGIEISLAASGVIFILIVIGLALPNSPMQIGTTQFAFAIGLGLDGTPATPAVAASIVYTAFLILPTMLIGGVLLLRGGIGSKS